MKTRYNRSEFTVLPKYYFPVSLSASRLTTFGVFAPKRCVHTGTSYEKASMRYFSWTPVCLNILY